MYDVGRYVFEAWTYAARWARVSRPKRRATRGTSNRACFIEVDVQRPGIAIPKSLVHGPPARGRPLPVCRLGDKPAFDRVAVDVVDLSSEFLIIADVAIESATREPDPGSAVCIRCFGEPMAIGDSPFTAYPLGEWRLQSVEYSRDSRVGS